MKHIKLFEQFVNEKIEYPEGVKTTDDKILDKVAKLLNSSKGIIEIGSGSVRGKKVPFINLIAGIFSLYSFYSISKTQKII